jgi:hypothetical protein
MDLRERTRPNSKYRHHRNFIADQSDALFFRQKMSKFTSIAMKKPKTSKYAMYGIVYVANINGHRRAYMDLTARLFDLSPLAERFSWNLFVTLVRVPRLLFATVCLGGNFEVHVRPKNSCPVLKASVMFHRPTTEVHYKTQFVQIASPFERVEHYHYYSI